MSNEEQSIIHPPSLSTPVGNGRSYCYLGECKHGETHWLGPLSKEELFGIKTTLLMDKKLYEKAMNDSCAEHCARKIIISKG